MESEALLSGDKQTDRENLLFLKAHEPYCYYLSLNKKDTRLNTCDNFD